MQVDSYSGTLSSLLEGLGPRSSRGQADSSAQYAEISAEIRSESSRREEVSTSPSSTSGATVAASIVAQSSSTVEQTASTSSSSGTEPATRAATTAATSLETPTAATTATFAASSPQDPSPAAPWPVNIVTPAIAPDLAAQSKSALAQAMTDAGLDPSQYKASYWEELVWYPGGNWTNRYITVQAPGGEKIDFDAAATLKSPHVTADILREHMTTAT